MTIATRQMLGGAAVAQRAVCVTVLHVADVLHAHAQQHLLRLPGRARHQIEMARIANALQRWVSRATKNPQLTIFLVELEGRLDLEAGERTRVARNPIRLGNPRNTNCSGSASAYDKDNTLDVADRNFCRTSGSNQFDPVRHPSPNSRGLHEHCLNVRESPCNTG